MGGGCLRIPQGSDGDPKSKRGAPKRRDPAKDEALLHEWANVRGTAGMTRKEFCVMKGITVQAFVQAQDRFRKLARG